MVYEDVVYDLFQQVLNLFETSHIRHSFIYYSNIETTYRPSP